MDNRNDRNTCPEVEDVLHEQRFPKGDICIASVNARLSA